MESNFKGDKNRLEIPQTSEDRGLGFLESEPLICITEGTFLKQQLMKSRRISYILALCYLPFIIGLVVLLVYSPMSGLHGYCPHLDLVPCK